MASNPDIDVRRLNSPGPISDAFLLSRAFVCVIIGPVGSAKTVTALRKLRRVGQRQKGKVDARGRTFRKARCGVIRESYPNIEKNTLPSWFRIHQESDGKFGWKAPYSHKLRLILREDADGNATDICDLEVEFRAIGDKSVEEACRGWEVNAVLIDEADLQPPDLLAFLSGRVGRFSDLDPDMVVDPQIILSLNAPYTDNWVYKLAVEKELGEFIDDKALVAALDGRPLIETFIQPGGREPHAENLHNLPNGRGYYLIQAALNKGRPGYVERMIDNKFVPMQHGQPVNPDFKYSDHVDDIEWDKTRPLILGVDQGLFAAAVAMQRTPMGQIRTLREQVIFREEGKSLLKVGPTAFGKMVRQMLNDNFPELRPEMLFMPSHIPGVDRPMGGAGAPLVPLPYIRGVADNRLHPRAGMLRVVADPAAFAADDRADNEHDWVLAFQMALGAKVDRAKSNRQALRLEAIHRAMAERDGYKIDPSCKHLIRAHLGGYHYRKAEISERETRGHLEIADTIHTHVADAEQYAALEGEHVVADIRGRPRSTAKVIVNSNYHPFGE